MFEWFKRPEQRLPKLAPRDAFARTLQLLSTLSAVDRLVAAQVIHYHFKSIEYGPPFGTASSLAARLGAATSGRHAAMRDGASERHPRYLANTLLEVIYEAAHLDPDSLPALTRATTDWVDSIAPQLRSKSLERASSAHTASPADQAAPTDPPPKPGNHAPGDSAKPEQRVLGGCRIEAAIGRGGSGIVYRAHHLALDIPVAVKVLSASVQTTDDDAAARFVREARIAARLSHPHIVRVYNLGAEGEIRFIVMELVRGGSLQDLLNKQKALSLAQVVSIARQTCEGLHFAHENGVVHRDLKPDNLLLELDGSVKITDLGLAKHLDASSGITHSGVVMGTPHYMAPEQAISTASVDRRCDIYSLGCVLFRMLAGKMPYAGEQLIHVLYMHLHAPIPDVRIANPAVPEPLAMLIRRMMAKDPGERYSSTQGILDVLESLPL